VRRRVTSLLLALAACGEVDEADVCQLDYPVQIVATDNLDLVVSAGPMGTVVALTDKYNQDDIRTVGGPECGAPAHDLVEGLAMVPARVHLDPADDDPTIVCDTSSRNFFRLDPTGEVPPELLMPYLDCSRVAPTPYGPIVMHWTQAAQFLVPDFPDDETAELILDGAFVESVAGDNLIYRAGSDEIRRLDLVTREDILLRTAIYILSTTATHMLWLSNIDYEVSPVGVVELATGENHTIGLSANHDLEPDEPYRSTNERTWYLDPSGRSILHVPLAAASPMEAFNLTGAPLTFPQWGTPVLILADGTHVIADGEQVFTARPGDDDVVTLDWQYGSRSRSVVARDGALEVQMEQDLYRVPLDGGPRSLLALQVGVRREWLDEHNILTIFDDSLETIRIGANVRKTLGQARDFVRIPGRGVYFNNVLSFEQPQNGVWFAPEHVLRPQLAPCLTSYYCR